MKALVYTDVETLTYRDAPDPEPGAGEALIRVESVGICGSDMHAWLGHDNRRPAPLPHGIVFLFLVPHGPRHGNALNCRLRTYRVMRFGKIMQ